MLASLRGLRVLRGKITLLSGGEEKGRPSAERAEGVLLLLRSGEGGGRMGKQYNDYSYALQETASPRFLLQQRALHSRGFYEII